jgi:hypothetical protein
VWHPLAAKPHREIQKEKKEKKNPERFCAGGKRGAHTKSRLRLVLVLLE